MGVEQRNIMVTLRAQQQGAPRLETLMGREYRVVDAVMVLSQVLHNNLGATYLPEDEITENWANAWNNIPVIVGPHPTVRGVAVSGRTPAIINERCGGYVFNARVGDVKGVRALCGDVWLELARADHVVGMKDILAKLDNGDMVELSTGFPTLIEDVVGVHNGQQYNTVLRPIGTDHLAVFADSTTGACSVNDGCGLVANEEDEKTTEQETTTMPEPGAVALTDAPAATEDKDLDSSKVHKGLFARVYDSLKSFVRGSDEDVQNITNPSDDELRRMLSMAIKSTYAVGQRAGWHCIIDAVFQETKTVIYWWDGPMGPDPTGFMFYQAEYSMDANGNITLANPQLVIRRTTYEPAPPQPGQPGYPAVSTQQEEVQQDDVTNTAGDPAQPSQGDGMDRTAMIAALAKAGPLDEASLNKLSDCQLKGLLSANAAPAAPAATAAPAPATTETQTQQDQAAINKLLEQVTALSTKVDAQNTEIASLKSAAAPAIEERETARKELVEKLSTNERVKGSYSKEELAALSYDNLLKIAQVADVRSYAGRGGPRSSINMEAEAEEQFAEPVPYWKKDAANQDAGKGGK